MIRILLLLLLALCPLTATLRTRPPAEVVDICEEYPTYAKARRALAWLDEHPPTVPPSGSMMGHAYLDSLYDSLYAQGEVSAIPPTCTVTTRSDVSVYAAPGGDITGTLPAGSTANVYALSQDEGWWYVITPAGGGWIPRTLADLQPGADLSAIPRR